MARDNRRMSKTQIKHCLEDIEVELGALDGEEREHRISQYERIVDHYAERGFCMEAHYKMLKELKQEKYTKW